ncbi:MAG: polysaccharide biosynthesis protein [Clostridiales bacterium]|nr:polysaccharide biosynthesis protein [Clostridiales bacterium]
MKTLVRDTQLLVRRLFLVVLDILIINITSFMALWTRFDFSIANIDQKYISELLSYTLINTVITLGIFWVFRLYHSLWKFASIDELVNIIFAIIASEIVQYIGMKLLHIEMPRSYFPLDLIFMLGFITCSRFAYRFLRRASNQYHAEGTHKTMIIGAGDAANIIIKEIINSSYLEGKVVCAIDDDKSKIGKYIQGVKIVGNRNTILENVEKFGITDIIIAMPSASQKVTHDILNICKETSCKLKILPGVYQLINEEVSVSRLKNVEIEDLLGRDPIETNLDEVMNYVSGKVVMVTGGGGSIGSELCRQVVKYKPKQLVIIDIYENNAYDIQMELKRNYPELNLVVLIASIRNTKRMNQIFEKYHPEIIYHAAAHKHVPLMEDSPNEAIKNNVYGTLKIVRAADRYGVKRFIQISTDKAVNPTNIMGASKRLCEMIIQAYNNRSNTEFVAVRFGNVLGSNGSVIPLFKKQIAEGGPVTVTHPDIIRYFMTIPEAVALVLQAGTYAKGGEIFVLDMGSPVKIDDMARNLIRLSGYTPDRDIQIKYTGLRPGEKLYEELLMDEEGMKETANKRIHIGQPIKFDEDVFFEKLDKVCEEATDESDHIRELVQDLVPTYHYKIKE